MNGVPNELILLRAPSPHVVIAHPSGGLQAQLGGAMTTIRLERDSAASDGTLPENRSAEDLADEFDYAHRLALTLSGRGIFGQTGSAAQVEDRIAHDLARAVEGDVAAAVALEQFYAALFQKIRRGDYVRRFRVAAQSDDWCVFQQQKYIADFFFFAKSDQFLL